MVNCIGSVASREDARKQTVNSPAIGGEHTGGDRVWLASPHRRRPSPLQARSSPKPTASLHKSKTTSTTLWWNTAASLQTADALLGFCANLFDKIMWTWCVLESEWRLVAARTDSTARRQAQLRKQGQGTVSLTRYIRMIRLRSKLIYAVIA